MRNSICCVFNCRNSSRNSKCTFHRFPGRKYLIKRKDRWINAVQKINGKSWSPNKSSVICSYHFVGGTPSLEEGNPGYVPTIFGKQHSKLLNESQAINRYNRHKKRVLSSVKSSSTSTHHWASQSLQTDNYVYNDASEDFKKKVQTDTRMELQEDIVSKIDIKIKSYDDYIDDNSIFDSTQHIKAEDQTDIIKVEFQEEITCKPEIKIENYEESTKEQISMFDSNKQIKTEDQISEKPFNFQQFAET